MKVTIELDLDKESHRNLLEMYAGLDIVKDRADSSVRMVPAVT